MKKTTLLLLALIAFNQTFTQHLRIPMNLGGANDGGTILNINLTDNSYVAQSMMGRFSHYENQISEIAGISSANSGIYYDQNSSSLYITREAGTRFINNNDDSGIIYKYDLNTKKTKLIHLFTSGNDGEIPLGQLVKVGNKLYGVTYGGGEFSYGTIFSIDLSDDSFNVEFSFNGTTDGGKPSCALYVHNNILYGAGKRGNGSDGQVYFSYNPNTSTYTNLYSNTNSVSHGPAGVFVRNDQMFVSILNGIDKLDINNPTGTTTHFGGQGSQEDIGFQAYDFTFRTGDASWLVVFAKGGINDHGSIGRVNFSSPPVTNIHEFQGGNLGNAPSIKLTNGLNGDVYGIANSTNGQDDRVLFKLSDIGVYSVLHNFSGDGIFSAPVLVGSKLYGTTTFSGANGVGSI